MPSVEKARQWYSETDSVHDFGHVLRVYRLAEHIARKEGADLEIVRAATLLHDAQGSSPTDESKRLGHHETSAVFAAEILAEEGWPEEKITAVQHCIRAHRFRSTEPPETIEAQSLFDADKLDAIGAIGAARAISYAVLAGQPVYEQPSDEFLTTFKLQPGESHTAYHEFLFKLSKIKDRMYTQTGVKLAQSRHDFLADFFDQLGAEVRGEK
jgi:uncharacterized protein